MKRVSYFVLICILLLTLAACGGSPSEPITSSGTVEEVMETLTNKVQSTPEVSQIPADEQDKTESDVPVTEPVSKEQPMPSTPTESNFLDTEEPSPTPAMETAAPLSPEPTVPSPSASPVAPPAETSEADVSMMSIKIIADEKTFSAKLYNNQAAKAFLSQLPLTITMDDLNRNEKYYYLASNLPSDSYRPEEIKSGDLMLYGSDCLVLFYESFSTSYSYTQLGFIEDASELSGVLGSGSVQVTFRAE